MQAEQLISFNFCAKCSLMKYLAASFKASFQIPVYKNIP